MAIDLAEIIVRSGVKIRKCKQCGHDLSYSLQSCCIEQRSRWHLHKDKLSVDDDEITPNNTLGWKAAAAKWVGERRQKSGIAKVVKPINERKARFKAAIKAMELRNGCTFYAK